MLSRLRSSLCLVLAVAAASAFAFAEAERISPVVHGELAEAQAALALGDLERAEAYAALAASTDLAVEVEAEDPASARQAVALAAGLWRTATDGLVRIRLVEAGEGDVRLRFHRDVWHAGLPVAGRATTSRRAHRWLGGGWSWQITGTAEIRTTWKDRRLTPAEMAHTVAHELGHALGLADSFEPGDLMGPFTPGSPILAPRRPEVEALREVHRAAEETQAIVQFFRGTLGAA